MLIVILTVISFVIINFIKVSPIEIGGAGTALHEVMLREANGGLLSWSSSLSCMPCTALEFIPKGMEREVVEILEIMAYGCGSMGAWKDQ